MWIVFKTLNITNCAFKICLVLSDVNNYITTISYKWIVQIILTTQKQLWQNKTQLIKPGIWQKLDNLYNNKWSFTRWINLLNLLIQEFLRDTMVKIQSKTKIE